MTPIPPPDNVCSRCRLAEIPGEREGPGARAWCRRWEMPIPDPEVVGCLDFIPLEGESEADPRPEPAAPR
ncbi:MAG: hypothetical protein HY320_00535 [Armatimonadetes bacterium]|nr:hypothetical protein [Armatimonadota bacterium]